MQFQCGQTLLVLLVLEKCSCCQYLKADVIAKQFVLLKQSVHFLEISVSEIALSQQIDACDGVVGEGDQFVSEEDGIVVVVDVEVVDCQFVESSEDFVAEDLGGEGLQLLEVVFWVCSVVWLQQFCQEEDPMCFCGCEDGGFLMLSHLNFICLLTHQS